MDDEIRTRAREIYTTQYISHSDLAKQLSAEFQKPIDLEITKQWAKMEGWTDQRMKNLSAKAQDGERIQVMKDIIWLAMLEGPTPTEMQKLTSAYGNLMKIPIPPDKGGEKRPDDLLRHRDGSKSQV